MTQSHYQVCHLSHCLCLLFPHNCFSIMIKTRNGQNDLKLRQIALTPTLTLNTLTPHQQSLITQRNTSIHGILLSNAVQLLEDPKAHSGQMGDIIALWVWVPQSPSNGHTQKSSKGRCPGDIFIRCLNHLFLYEREITLSSHQMSKFFTSFLRLNPLTLQRKHILAYCMCNLIL